MKKIMILLLLIIILPSFTFAKPIHAYHTDIGSLKSVNKNVETFIHKACSKEYSFDYTQEFFDEAHRKQYTFLYNNILAYNLPLTDVLISYDGINNNILTYKVSAMNSKKNKVKLIIAIEVFDEKMYLKSLEQL